MTYISYTTARELAEKFPNDMTFTTDNFYGSYPEMNVRFCLKPEDMVRLQQFAGFKVIDKYGDEVPPIRPSWDEYFLGFAKAASERAECSRRQVGAVVVKNKRVIGTGYNGAYKGAEKTCLTGDCPRAKSSVSPGSSYDTGAGSCIAIHAEANALLDAGRRNCEGAALYITCKPCDGCLRLIKAAGIKRVVWPDGELKKKDLYV